MSVKLKTTKNLKDTLDTVVLLAPDDDAASYVRSEAERAYVRRKIKDQSGMITINQYDRLLVIVPFITDKTDHLLDEAYRKKGVELFNVAKREKISVWQI